MSDRRAAERRGRLAEVVCAWTLRLKGYAVLDRRFRSPAGEIDIVARRSTILAIVEVKARRDVETAAEATTARQRARLVRAAALYISRRPQLGALPLRFDLMLVIPWRLPIHIRDAWQPDL